MKRRTRLTSNEQQQATQSQQQNSTPLEFETAEELLRFDAAQTEVPASVAERLQESVGPQPGTEKPWWKRWLGQD